ncbi:MAG: hypothetical protein P9M14_15655 [Candidatus Alcyoniella australis]|nr:hypothetical protein [Candidatus Alcyoniella australis]
MTEINFVLAAKFSASLFTALSAALVLLILRRSGHRPGVALFAAVVYGLATSSWSISSQSLWQHGFAQFWLALGLWWFLAN